MKRILFAIASAVLPLTASAAFPVPYQSTTSFRATPDDFGFPDLQLGDIASISFRTTGGDWRLSLWTDSESTYTNKLDFTSPLTRNSIIPTVTYDDNIRVFDPVTGVEYPTPPLVMTNVVLRNLQTIFPNDPVMHIDFARQVNGSVITDVVVTTLGGANYVLYDVTSPQPSDVVVPEPAAMVWLVAALALAKRSRR